MNGINYTVLDTKGLEKAHLYLIRMSTLNTGEWDFKSPGFTAIAHPASVSLAKNHGVFVLEDMKSPWESYQKGNSLIHVL